MKWEDIAELESLAWGITEIAKRGIIETVAEVARRSGKEGIIGEMPKSTGREAKTREHERSAQKTEKQKRMAAQLQYVGMQ